MSPHGTPEPAPAFWFPDPEFIADALADWGQARRGLDAARDPLIAAALNHNISWKQITALTGIAESTISRIPRRPAAHDAFDTIVVYTKILETRADNAKPTGDTQTRAGAQAAAAWMMLRDCASTLSGDKPVPPGYPDSDDGRLFAQQVWLRQAAADGGDASIGPFHAGWNEGTRETAEMLAAEIHALRARGMDVLDADEVAAAEAALRTDSLNQQAGLLGVDPAEFAALSPDDRARLWAELPDPRADHDDQEPTRD